MAARKIDRNRVARVLADAIQFGDAKACAQHDLSLRTLQNYRVRLRTDPELAGIFAQKRAEEETEWREVRLRFLREGIEKLRTLVSQAGVEQMRDVAGAVKIVGDLQVASDALSTDEHHGDDRTGAGAPAHATDDAGANVVRLAGTR